MRANEPKRHTVATAVLAMVVVLTAAASAGAVPVCGAPANCSVAANMQRCTEMWTYGLGTHAMTAAPVTTGAATACSVNIMSLAPLVVTFVASQPTTVTAMGGCSFGGTFGQNPTAAYTFTCTIDDASGLPVELMDFEVDGDSDEEDH